MIVKSTIEKIAYYITYAFIFLPLTLLRRNIDNDFWFIINHGRYICENGFTTIEPFTVHNGLNFTLEKWLTCVTYYKIYSNFGEKGVFIFHYLCAAIHILLTYKLLKHITNNRLISILLTIINDSIFILMCFTTRPQAISYILLIAELYCLERYAESKRVGSLYMLPILSILYMQFHSTMWPVFFLFMLPYIFEFKIISKKMKLTQTQYKKMPILIAASVCFATLFINPYGAKSIFYIFKSINGIKIFNISELRQTSVYTYAISTIQIYLVLIWYIARSIYNLKETKIIDMPLRYIYLLAGTFIMSTVAVRNLAYLLIAGILASAYALKDIDIDKKLYFPTKCLLTAVGILILITTLACSITNNPNYYVMTPGKAALDALREYDKRENVKLYTYFNAGSYAEWLKFKTYIDPRAEVFIKDINNKEDIQNEAVLINNGTISHQEIQDKYNFDYWLVEEGALNTALSADKDYELIINKNGYRVYKVAK